MADKVEKLAGEIWMDEAARLLMVTATRVAQLQRTGDIPKGRLKGVVPLVGCVQGYINFIKREKRYGSRSVAEDRIREARAREIELRNAQRDHILIELDEAIAVADEIVGLFRSELIGLPARLTRDRTLRTRLDNELTATLNRVADRLQERAGDLRSTGSAPSGADEEVGGGVGSGEPDLSADDRPSRSA